MLITAAATGSAVASGTVPKPVTEDPRLTGSAKLHRSDGDDVRFAFDARFRKDQRPDQARGTFSVRHVSSAGSGAFTGRIDCLVTGGKVAVASGIVTETDVPRLKGKRVGFTVHDQGGHDRVGYSWAATNDPAATKDLPKCVSSAPFETVERGDFTVVPWEPDH
ncbi:hypothetical protein KGS77_04025 [Streptomyces sp. MST-110588]|nr:hypothetical protein [Streptomyces sp. MST-110588]UNO43683.1 hypothetical protein KGS77_04025 [Streptomyces sp. MST-110588]